MKIYLDTNVISGLCEQKNHVHHIEGNKFFKRINIDHGFEIFISDLVIEELKGDTKHWKQHQKDIEIIKPTIIKPNENIISLSSKLINNQIVKSKNVRDAIHIAYCLESNLDLIVSWNFDDIVNITTIKKLKIFCLLNNLKELDIHNPMEVK